MVRALPCLQDSYRQARAWAEPTAAFFQAVSQCLAPSDAETVRRALSDDQQWSAVFNTAAWRNEMLAEMESATVEASAYAARIARRATMEIMDLVEDVVLDLYLADAYRSRVKETAGAR